ncbi:MAG: hypothetical protein JWN46_2184, partial [Acidimicrobiales bacterium]|nr:hypothetical protein [Acidimicrobiales bacterium]
PPAARPTAVPPTAAQGAATTPAPSPRVLVPPPHVPGFTPTGAVPAPARPLAVGPPAAGRWKARVPLVAAAVGLSSAAPVAVTIGLVLIVLPVLATWGDSLLHGARRDAGLGGRWIDRATAPAAMAPPRFVRNVVVSVVRSAPVLAVGAVLIGGWYGLVHLSSPTPVLDLALRAIGAVVALGLVVPAGRGSPRFRTGLAVDHLLGRLVDPAGRVGQRGLVLLVGAAFFVAAGLWLSPEVWPLPR